MFRASQSDVFIEKLTSAEQMEECMSSLEAGKLVKDESYYGQSTAVWSRY